MIDVYHVKNKYVYLIFFEFNIYFTIIFSIHIVYFIQTYNFQHHHFLQINYAIILLNNKNCFFTLMYIWIHESRILHIR